MANSMIVPRYLRFSTARQYMNCSKDSLDRLVNGNYLKPKYIPPNDEPRIDREEIDALMKGRDLEAITILSADTIVDDFLSAD